MVGLAVLFDARMTDAGRFTLLSTVFYAAVLAVAGGVAWSFDLRVGPDQAHLGTGAALAVGVAAGGGLIVASEVLERRSESVRRLSRTLADSVPRLSWPQAAVCAMSSSAAEEVVFRGLMQPHWGLLASSAIFGLCHGSTRRELRMWAVLAGGAGLLLGGLSELTGELAAPIAAHATLNTVNLMRLQEKAGQADLATPDGGCAPVEPRSVATEVREPTAGENA